MLMWKRTTLLDGLPLIKSGGHPDVYEHYSDLVWIYAKTEPLDLLFLLCLTLNRGNLVDLKKKNSIRGKECYKLVYVVRFL